MSESAPVMAEKSNGRLSRPIRGLGTLLPLLRSLWPVKTDAQLASRIGLSDRWCREILAERAGLTAEALAALLRTEDGSEVLEALMGDAKPKWWRKFKRQMGFAEVRRLQDEARAKLEALEREEI
jgi:hypothetical protein